MSTFAAGRDGVLTLYWLAACGEPQPMEVLDRFEVVSAVRGGAELDHDTVGAGTATENVVWAREVWELERDRFTLERDVLFAGPGDRFTACEAAVTVQIAWTDGVLIAPYAAKQVSRITSRDPATPAEYSCEAAIAAGEWAVYRSTGTAWSQEARAPNGDVVRLKLAQESPEYRTRTGRNP